MRMWLIKEVIRYNKIYVLMCLQREILKSIDKADSIKATKSPDIEYIQGELYVLYMINGKIEKAIREIRKGEDNETQR